MADDEIVDKSLRNTWELKQLNQRIKEQAGKPAESIYDGVLSNETRAELKNRQETEAKRRNSLTPLEEKREQRDMKEKAEAAATKVIADLERSEAAANDDSPFEM